jgi:hypothetical protein
LCHGLVKNFFKGCDLICEASGPDFQTAMTHTTLGGIAPDEPWTANLEVPDPRIEHGDGVSESESHALPGMNRCFPAWIQQKPKLLAVFELSFLGFGVEFFISHACLQTL